MTVTSLLRVCEYRVDEAVGRGDLEQHRIRREELIERIAGIVSRNLASGRARRVMAASKGAEERGGQGDKETLPPLVSPSPPLLVTPASPHPGTESGRLEGYIDRVIAGYLQEHGRVEALAARDETAWIELHAWLAGRACRMLRRRQVPPARATNEAPDFAQQTCEVLFDKPFPYDVPFDAWSSRILANLIQQHYTRSGDPMDRSPGVTSLDRPDHSATGDDFSLYELLADEAGETVFERSEVQDWLLQAIAGLRSQAQQAVIIDTYFYELSDDEIAGDLGKSRQAIYNLRHRALQYLRQTLNGG